MTNNTIAIIDKVQKFDSHMSIKYVDGEIQITASLSITAPFIVMLYGNLNEWIDSEKTLWDEPEEYFQKRLRYAIEECTDFAGLLNLLRDKLDDFNSNATIFKIEDSVKLIIIER